MVVKEIRNSITKKNKEWQEKLLIVVLKAEDMYSKANSEVGIKSLSFVFLLSFYFLHFLSRRTELWCIMLDFYLFGSLKVLCFAIYVVLEA
ncbi:hypothetical protein ACFX1S_043925 [Malus domestica]